MSFPANDSSIFLFGGNSVTALTTGILGNWAGEPGSFIDQSRAMPILSAPPVVPINYIPARAGQVASAVYTALAQRGRRQVMRIYGVGGRTASGIAADMAASVYVWQPTIFALEIGTNDFPGTDVTPGGAFQTSYNQILDGTHTNLPNCKILCLSPPCRSEAWTAGPHMSGGLDTWAGLARIQESVAARSSFCEYVDLLTPALAFQVQYQPVAGSSVSPFELTQDSLHPSARGKRLIAQAVLSHITWS